MTKNHKNLLLLLVIFVLPVVLAKLALDYDWFNRGATNQGELVEPGNSFAAIQPNPPEPRWKLVYVMPDECQRACENALMSINQVWLALGRESDRVEAVAVTTAEQPLAVSYQQQYPHITELQSDQSKIDEAFGKLHEQGIYVVDTLQNIVLKYQLHYDQKDAVMSSRAMLADVKKLLKLSRIG